MTVAQIRDRMLNITEFPSTLDELLPILEFLKEARHALSDAAFAGDEEATFLLTVLTMMAKHMVELTENLCQEAEMNNLLNTLDAIAAHATTMRATHAAPATLQ